MPQIPGHGEGLLWRLCHRDGVGAASGTASALIDLGLGGGPILMGFVAQAAGIPWAFGVAASVALAGSVWTLSLCRASTRS